MCDRISVPHRFWGSRYPRYPRFGNSALNRTINTFITGDFQIGMTYPRNYWEFLAVRSLFGIDTYVSSGEHEIRGLNLFSVGMG
jgi:hypothetical protein